MHPYCDGLDAAQGLHAAYLQGFVEGLCAHMEMEMECLRGLVRCVAVVSCSVRAACAVRELVHAPQQSMIVLAWFWLFRQQVPPAGCVHPGLNFLRYMQCGGCTCLAVGRACWGRITDSL